MSTIFIGGSRRIAALPPDVARRLVNVMERHHDVIVGDAPGADTAVQRSMMAANYRQVTVYCSGGQCRNNLHGWPNRHITPPAHAHGFRFYAAKDRAMARAADFGLMVWDGRSPGTLANAMRLAQTGKPTVLHDLSQRTTFTIRDAGQWREFAASVSAAVLDALIYRVASEES